MIRKFFAAFALIFFVMSSTAFAADGIDWERGVIRVTGIGAPPENFDPKDSSARTFARQAARMDALRNLYEMIAGSWVTATSTVRDFEIENNNVLSRMMQANLNNDFGIKQINIVFHEDGDCQVTLELPIFNGKGSLADMALIPFENEPKVSFPEPTTNVSLDNAKYTGLIVDCRGMGGFNCVVLPTIKNSNGTPIYGYQNIADEKILENGLVGYVTDLNSANRAGNNPLVVKAICLDNLTTTPVISVADADKILTANQRDKFLNNCAVVFVG